MTAEPEDTTFSRAGREAGPGMGGLKTRNVNRMLEYGEDGLLFDSLLDVRVMAIDAHFYRGMRNRLYRNFQTGASAILYEMGLGYGEQMGKIISKLGAGRLGVYSNFIQRGKQLGMGRFETPVIQMIVSGLKGEPVVRLRESFFASAMGKTGQAECHIFAGMIAGSARVVLKKEFDCVEERCMSKGDSECFFRLHVRDNQDLNRR